MKNFVIEIKSQTASFRNPTFQNYHKSLELPPPTTIIGFAGAALGLTPLRVQEFFDEFVFKIGILGKFRGKYQDTWKYLKHPSNMRQYDPGLDAGVIQREYLVDACFLLAFSSSYEVELKKLMNAFKNPVYALTMGNSDSLAKILEFQEDLELTQSNQIENSFVPGNVVADVISLAEKGKLEFSVYTNDTLVYDLPTRFSYESDYGKRTISKTGTFSLIGEKMKLNYEIEGLKYKNHFIPLFSL